MAEIYTVVETGLRQWISPGEWNSPKDGLRERPSYWTFVPDGTLSLGLRAGEWDTVPAADVPLLLRTQAEEHFTDADCQARPWAY